MGIEGEGGVHDESEVASQGGGGDGGVVDGEGDGSGFVEGRFGANEEEFSFVAVELEEVVS